MSKTLPCGITVSGEVFAIGQLKAKFQVKARDYGLSDEESLAVYEEGEKHSPYTQSGKVKLQSAPKIWNL